MENQPTKPEKSSKAPKVFIFSCVGCVLLLVLLMCCFVFSILVGWVDTSDLEASFNDMQDEFDSAQQDADSQNGEEVDTQEESTTTYDGTYISAELPDGWTITEYEDAEGGYGLLADGTYTGLTAITISNADDDVVFTIEGVNGIGGTGICDEVYEFSDTESDFVDEMQSDSFSLYGVTPDVVDLTDEDYVEFDFFGNEGRLTTDGVYWNVSNDPGVFNANCADVKDFFQDTGLSFSYSYLGTEATIETYMTKVTNSYTYEDAEELGEILTSFELN